MKMEYQKPMAAVEFYHLSQSIAACAIKINLLDNDCVVYDNDTPEEMRSAAFDVPSYFSTPCDIICTNNQDYDGLCYHTQLNATFTST